MLTSKYYSSKKIFNQEIKQIFEKHWNFLCFKSDFDNKYGSIIREINGHSIIVTKSENDFRAFHNSCSHRGAPILKNKRFSKFKGIKISCSYHGWSYNLDGTLNKIPFNDECYYFSKKKCSRLGLKQLSIDIIGELLFINFQSKPKNLRSQINKKLFSQIESLFHDFKAVKKISIEKKFNWKLIIENLKDPLHPLFIHKKTLLQNVNSGVPGIPRFIPFFLFAPLSFLNFGGFDVNIKARSYFDKINKKNNFPMKYFNAHIFPNIHVASSDQGRSTMLEIFTPLGPNKTKVDIYILFNQHQFKNKFFDDFIKKYVVGALRVYDEDFGILEKIQRNIKYKDTKFNIGRYERLILRFWAVYCRKLGIRHVLIYLKNLLFK